MCQKPSQLANLCLAITFASETKTVENDNKSTVKKIDEPSVSASTSASASLSITNKDTKDKRQIGGRETRLYPNAPSEDPEQPQETIYGPPPSANHHFIIRAENQQQQQQHQQQSAFQPSQPLNQQQQEQELPYQHFAYLQDVARNSPTKSSTKQHKAHQSKQSHSANRPVQYLQEVPQYNEQPHSQQPQHHLLPHRFQQPNSYRPQQQQQQQHYQQIPEEQLLKLIEEELASRGFPVGNSARFAPPSQSAVQTNPKGTSGQRTGGLGNYRQQTPDENNSFVRYIPQPLPQEQYANQQQAVDDEQAHIYLAQSPIDYHKSIPNHPLAASTLEKEIEKLLASNKPSGQNKLQRHHQHTSELQAQNFVASRAPQKSYATTPTPAAAENDYSFIPAFAQFSGFQPIIQPSSAPLNNDQAQKSRQYLPKAHSSSSQLSGQQQQTQYLIETSPKPKFKSNSSPYQIKQYYNSLPTHKQQQHVDNKNSAVKIVEAPSDYQYEDARSQIYYKNPNVEQYEQAVASPQQQQQQQQQQHQHQPHHYVQQQNQHHKLQVPAPSQSTIYVAQSTGVHPLPKNSQQTKVSGSEKALKFPPTDGKPITQEEFQALVDAGYAVQAVPVPVPVPYDQYIKDHPEYKGEAIEVPLRRPPSSAVLHQNRQVGPVTFLRPLQQQQRIHLNQDEIDQQQQQQSPGQQQPRNSS